MYIINGSLWLTWEQLQEQGVPVGTLKAGCLRFREGKTTSWNNVPDPKDARRCLVSYDSLPPATKTKLPSYEALVADYQAQETAKVQSKRALADVTRQAASMGLASRIVEDLRCIEQLMKDGYTLEEAQRIARLAAWMKFVASLKPSEAKVMGYRTKAEFETAVCEAIYKEYVAKLVSSKITNIVVLRRNAHAFSKDGLSAIISGKKGNQNALILTDDHRFIIRDWYFDSRKPSIQDVYEEYRFYYQNVWRLEPSKMPSYATVKRYLGSSEIQNAAYKFRNGEHNYRLKYRPHTHGRAPIYSHTLVCGDGIVFGESVFIPKGHPYREGKKKDTELGSLTAWVWFDRTSGAIVGFRFGLSETGEMIRLSFRQILKLHGGAIPMSVHIDTKWSGEPHVAEMFYNAGVSIEKKRPYNPNESMAERFNKELGACHRMISERWINITNHDIRFIRKGDELPKGSKPRHIDEAIEMFMDVITMYNERPLDKYEGKSRIEMHAENIHPSCQVMDEFQRMFHFGARTAVKVDRGIVRIEVNRKQFEFAIDDWGKVSAQLNRAQRVRVVYDEDDLSHIDIYRMGDENNTDEDRFLCTCEALARYNKARIEQTDEDRAIMGRQLERARTFDEYNERIAAEQSESADDLELRANLQKYGQARVKAWTSTETATKYRTVADDEYQAQKEASELVELTKSIRQLPKTSGGSRW